MAPQPAAREKIENATAIETLKSAIQYEIEQARVGRNRREPERYDSRLRTGNEDRIGNVTLEEISKE